MSGRPNVIGDIQRAVDELGHIHGLDGPVYVGDNLYKAAESAGFDMRGYARYDILPSSGDAIYTRSFAPRGAPGPTGGKPTPKSKRKAQKLARRRNRR